PIPTSILRAAEKSSPTRRKSMRANPLLAESALPFHMPPFDKIRNEDFAPAYEKGMSEELKQVQTIATNPEKPTFENTIVAMERTGILLDRLDRIFSNLAACNTNLELQKIEKEMAPKLAAHQDAIHLNSELFARVQTIYDNRDKFAAANTSGGGLGLDPETNWLVERYYKDFVRAGANVLDPDKEKLKAINAELAELQTTFAQNVLKEKNASSIVVDDRAQLQGLSESDIAAAAATAKTENKEGKFVLALQNTTGQPALATLQERQLREKIMETSLARDSHGGEFDNRAVVLRMVKLRAERAALLGYPNHAAYQLEDQT